MDKRLLRFREIAYKRWIELEEGNSKVGNKYYYELLEIATLLRSIDKLNTLELLLNDYDDGVVFEAAAKLLTLNHSGAVEAMSKLMLKRGILPFTAKQTLKQWEMGKLRF